MNNHQLSTNNYQLLEGYQQTEVGVIPEDWEVYTIGETVTLINGRAFKPSDWAPYGLPIIRIQNLNDPIAPYNYYEGAVEERYYVNFGDILFAWSGTKESSFGARMWRGQKAILNQHIFRVVPNEEKLSSQYVLLALKRFQEDIERKSHGFKSSFVHVRKSDLENTHLAIPPLEEQRSIVQSLSDVDALIAALDKAIAKKRHLKTATMQQLLTGKKRLPGFGEGKGYKESAIGEIPEDWGIRFLGDIFNLGNGFSFKSEYFSSNGPIVLTPGNFKLEGGLYFNDRNTKRYSGDFPESTVFEKGDLLVVMTDLTPDCNLLGKPAFVDSEEKILHNQRIGKIRLLSENFDKQFLYFTLLSSSYLRKIKDQATGSTVRHTSNKSIYSVSLPIPKQLEEQHAIATVLSDMDAAISALETHLAKTQSIKQGMMQQLLTGKVRLKIEAGMDAGREDD